MTDNMFHFSHEPLEVQLRRSRETFNTLRFAHDYGFDALKFAMAKLGTPVLVQGIAEQCAEMRLNGLIVMDAEGNEHRNAKIDLAKLGLSPEQVAEVERLDAANRAKSQPAVAADVLSDSAQMRAAGLDVGGEGYGAHAKRVIESKGAGTAKGL